MHPSEPNPREGPHATRSLYVAPIHRTVNIPSAAQNIFSLSERATPLKRGWIHRNLVVSVNSEGGLQTSSEILAEFESTRQTHNVIRVNLSFERSQFWQIVSVDVDERCIGVHVISVQRRWVIGEQSLRLGNGGETIC